MTRRVFRHYKDCEEYEDGGMWFPVSSPPERELFVRESSELMRDTPRFLEAMRRAVREWPNSCEHNLTCDSVNHLAWLGHAGCFLAVGSPEELTRLGWHQLNKREQDAANAAAEEALREWAHMYMMRATMPPLFDLEPFTVRRMPQGRPWNA